MPFPENFRSRASEYRRIAQNSQDQKRAGEVFEIAHLFDSMADNLRLSMPPATARPKPLDSGIWARTVMSKDRLVFLAIFLGMCSLVAGLLVVAAMFLQRIPEF